MSHKKYDEETYTNWKIELFDALGEKRKVEWGYMSEKPNLDFVVAKAKELGYDTFELTYTTDRVERFAVE